MNAYKEELILQRKIVQNVRILNRKQDYNLLDVYRLQIDQEAYL